MTAIEKKEYIIDNDGMSYLELESAFQEILIDENNSESQVIIEGIESFDLSPDEALHVLAYTGWSAKWINSNIINGKYLRNISCLLFIENLDKALVKIQTVNNRIVYHMTSHMIDNFSVGDLLKIPFYLSTAKEDFENSNIVWVISTLDSNSRGRDISTISNNKYEKEVLFLRNSKFKLKNIRKEGDKTLMYLDEFSD
jgi:hypothetical protein